MKNLKLNIRNDKGYKIKVYFESPVDRGLNQHPLKMMMVLEMDVNYFYLPPFFSLN